MFVDNLSQKSAKMRQSAAVALCSLWEAQTTADAEVVLAPELKRRLTDALLVVVTKDRVPAVSCSAAAALGALDKARSVRTAGRGLPGDLQVGAQLLV